MSAGYTYRGTILRDLIARKHSLPKDIVDLIITYLPDYKRIWAIQNKAIVLADILNVRHDRYTIAESAIENLPIDTRSVIKNIRLKSVESHHVNYDLSCKIHRFAVNTWDCCLTGKVYYMQLPNLFFIRTITQHQVVE